MHELFYVSKELYLCSSYPVIQKPLPDSLAMLVTFFSLLWLRNAAWSTSYPQVTAINMWTVREKQHTIEVNSGPPFFFRHSHTAD